MCDGHASKGARGTTVDRETAERALDTLRPAFDSDGFDLRLEGFSPPGEVVVSLEARPGACQDCLVPDEVLVQVIAAGIRQHQGGDEVTVSVVKKG